MEVFCKNCQHFSHWLIGADFFDTMFDNLNTDDKCKHPENITYTNQYNKKEKNYLADPSELNRHNNCPWYTEKFSFFKALSMFLKR